MENFYVWKILGIITIILLVVFGRKRNAVWGGLTVGIVIGFIVVLFSVFRDDGFDWYTIGKGGTVGVLLGFLAEALGRVSDYLKSKG